MLRIVQVAITLMVAAVINACPCEAKLACQEAIEQLHREIDNLQDDKIDSCIVKDDPTELGGYLVSGTFETNGERYQFSGFAWEMIPYGVPGGDLPDVDRDGWVTIIEHSRISSP